MTTGFFSLTLVQILFLSCSFELCFQQTIILIKVNASSWHEDTGLIQKMVKQLPVFLDGLIQVLISPFSPGQDSALLLAFFHDIFYPHIFHFSKQTFKIEQVIYGLVLRMLII